MMVFKNAMLTPLKFKSNSDNPEEDTFSDLEFESNFKFDKSLYPLALIVRQEFLKQIWEKIEKLV
jgi:hypothetical protein